MIAVVSLLSLLAAGAFDDPAPAALAKGNYPWYDSARDALRPVNPPEPPKETGTASQTPRFDLGIFVYVAIALAIAAAIAAIVWFTRNLSPNPIQELPRSQGRAARVFGPLPIGFEVDEDDPWNAAERARAAGDFRKAIIYLFAYELLALDELRLIRLAPGKTCRQLVRNIDEGRARAWVEPALRLFEAACYGRRPPTRDAFEHARSLAQELRSRATREGAMK